MKLTNYLIIAMMLCAGIDSNAQQFMNGSLEPTGTVITCDTISTTAYSSSIPNCFMAGFATNVRIMNNTCPSGAAADGSYYTALRYSYLPPIPPPGVMEANILILKLNKPFIADSAYKIAFSYKLDTTGGKLTTGKLWYGYTNTTTSKDSFGGSLNGLQSVTWKADTVTIKPKTSTQYVFFEPAYTGGFGNLVLHVDNFRVLGDSGTYIAGLENQPSINIYPNPASASVTIKTGRPLNGTLNVYDINGRVVLTRALQGSETEINTGLLNKGIYFVRILTDEAHVYTHKLMIE